MDRKCNFKHHFFLKNGCTKFAHDKIFLKGLVQIQKIGLFWKLSPSTLFKIRIERLFATLKRFSKKKLVGNHSSYKWFFRFLLPKNLSLRLYFPFPFCQFTKQDKYFFIRYVVLDHMNLWKGCIVKRQHWWIQMHFPVT